MAITNRWWGISLKKKKNVNFMVVRGEKFRDLYDSSSGDHVYKISWQSDCFSLLD